MINNILYHANFNEQKYLLYYFINKKNNKFQFPFTFLKNRNSFLFLVPIF